MPYDHFFLTKHTLDLFWFYKIDLMKLLTLKTAIYTLFYHFSLVFLAS